MNHLDTHPLRLLLTALLVAAMLAACGDDGNSNIAQEPEPIPEPDASPDPDPTPDASPDPEPEPDASPDPEPQVLPTEPQEGVDPEGVEVDGVEPEAGAVRAGVVREGTGGFGGVQVACRPGCFALVNSVARFCIEGRSTSSHIFFDGGRLIDAEPVGVPPYGNTEGRDRFDIAGTFIDSKTSSADQVEVIRDGSEDGLAVVRVTGREEPSMFLAGLLGPAFFQRRELEVITEYRLRADSRALEIVTFHTNKNGDRTNVIPGDIFFFGDTLEYYFPGAGDSTPRSTKEVLVIGKGIAYGLFLEEEAFPAGLIGLSLPALPLSLAGRRIEDGVGFAARRWLVVGPHISDVLESFFEQAPDHPSVFEGVKGTVRVTRAGAPLPDARIEMTALDDDGQPVGDTLWKDHTDEEGELPLLVTPGRYRFIIFDPVGGQRLRDAEITEGAEVEIDLPEVATLSIRVTELVDDQILPSPAKVRLVGGQAGERRFVFVLDGEESVELLPGGWTWEVSRGPEFTMETGQVVLEPGQDAEIEAQIAHVMFTPGFVSGEFHQHQSPSLDSEVPIVDRVLSNIGEGVDFAVSSDHDVATDFAPVIAELGAEDLIASLAGVEVSPLFGHFGAYPVDVDANKTGRGALPLSYKDDDGEIFNYPSGEAIIEAMRTVSGSRLIQSNHPRDSTGYFDTGGLDRSVGLGGVNPGFSVGFDTMEVVNGPLCEQLQDFYTLLNAGVPIIGVGNSDSHSISRPVGYPRNYIPATVESPRDLTQDMIVDGTLTGDLVISAAAYLEFGPGLPSDPEAVRPGRLVDAESVTIDVRAMTPPWAEVTQLYVIRNGLVVEELEIGAGPGELVDYDGPITLSTEGGADAWFQIIAYSPERLAVVYPGEQIYAMSNAFFLDADSDGEFDAPGLIELDPATIAFCQ